MTTTTATTTSNILIVDDELPNRRLLESLLKKHGYTTASCADGRAALGAVEGGGVDLVLLDVMMPELDGIEACRAIREQLRMPFLPVVLVTALNDHESRTRGKRAGADDFITKPVYAEELLARVQTLLRVRQLQARLDAERARVEAARERLASLVVHDLKNPLAVVRINLELVRNILGDSGAGAGVVVDAAAAIDDAVVATEQLQRMLLDLLDIGRAEDGRLPFAPSLGDLAAVLRRGAAAWHPEVARRGARLVVDAPPMRPTLFDEALILRVLQNLLTNAARFVPRDGVVEVSLTRRDDDQTAVIGVANNGPSIPADQRALIFEKFGQINAAQGQSNRGLGLYLCRLVAERHRGGIRVVDRDGGGVRFELTLPLAG